MDTRVKREIRNKARLAYCLVDILDYDVENLKNDANECHIDTLNRTLKETKEILQNLVDVVTEIEYILYLEQIEES